MYMNSIKRSEHEDNVQMDYSCRSRSGCVLCMDDLDFRADVPAWISSGAA